MAVWPRRGVAERRRDSRRCTGRRDGSGRAGRRAGHPGRVLRVGAQEHTRAAHGGAPCVSSRKEEKEGRRREEKKEKRKKREKRKRKKGEKEKERRKKERGEKEKEAPAGFAAAVGHARATASGRTATHAERGEEGDGTVIGTCVGTKIRFLVSGRRIARKKSSSAMKIF